MNMIPRATRVETSFYRGLTVKDIVVLLAGFLLSALCLSSNLDGKVLLALVFISLSVCMLVPFGKIKGYMLLGKYFRYLFCRKIFSDADPKSGTSALLEWRETEDGFLCRKDGKCCVVLKVFPINFGMMGEPEQEKAKLGLARALKAAEGLQVSIIKLEERADYSGFLQSELNRLVTLAERQEEGIFSEAEYQARVEIAEDRMGILDRLNESRLTVPGFYLELTGDKREEVFSSAREMQGILRGAGIRSHELVDQELSAYCSGNLLLADETELHRVRFGFRSTEVNKKMMVHFAVTGFPLFVPDGWAAELFRIPGAKVTLRWGRVEQEEACRRLDHAIMELTMQARGKASKVIDRTTHMESLSALLADIQKNQETLLDAVFIITTPDRKRVQKKLRQLGLEFTECYGLQREIFSFLQPGGGLEPSLSVSLSFSGLAAGFPFDSDIKQDEDGILLGENELPVFFNPFRTDEEYLNRNLMVIGKSGSGKSYAMKSLLAQLSTCEAKIFVLDPEGEYSALTRNLYGQVIDVSNGEQGKINPFHIFPTLEDQDNGNYSGSYYAHLQFLEKFFLLTLPVSGDDLELLNQMIAACYSGKKIDEHTNLSALRAEDYPTFEDLRSMMEMNASKGTAEQKAHLNRLLDHVKKFCRGGRFSNLWNGPTCLKARENFVCFDFQKLMANRNEQMANAQMLLVLKYLEGEIIRNREYCLQSGRKQEVVVAVDEAHVFVDENFPVALDFMYQLAKRIRKYNGMLIVATQSLQDFVGSRENLRKSMAIVNAAQYSMIFSLSPKDLSDLCRLYENAGGINEAEKQWIMQSQRGEAYLIASSRQRHRLRVVASDYIENMNGGSV